MIPTDNDMSLKMNNILIVLSIKKSLLSISKLTSENPVSVEFYRDFCVVKDLKTGRHLLRGEHRNGLYLLWHEFLRNDEGSSSLNFVSNCYSYG